MATNFLSSRGAVYKAIDSGDSRYAINPDFRVNGEKFATILTGYNVQEQEIVAQAACLNDLRVMYTFGKGFGNIQITGEMLLGAPEAQSSIEGALFGYYETNRVSVKKKPLTLSISGGGSIPFYLIGISVNQYNLELELLPFSLTGVVAK